MTREPGRSSSGGGGLAAEGDGLEVAQLHLPGRAADPARVERGGRGRLTSAFALAWCSRSTSSAASGTVLRGRGGPELDNTGRRLVWTVALLPGCRPDADLPHGLAGPRPGCYDTVMPGQPSTPFGHGPPARVEVRRDGGLATVVVHASVRPIVKGALVGWLGVWVMGEVVAVRLAVAAAESVLPFLRGFTLLFLAGWTVMGAFAAHALLWCIEGTEELSLDGEELVFRRQVRGLGRTRRFPLAKVRGPIIRYDFKVLSVDSVPPDALVKMSFDAGWHTYRINASLRHADALRVLAALGRGAAARARPQTAPPPVR